MVARIIFCSDAGDDPRSTEASSAGASKQPFEPSNPSVNTKFFNGRGSRSTVHQLNNSLIAVDQHGTAVRNS